MYKIIAQTSQKPLSRLLEKIAWVERLSTNSNAKIEQCLVALERSNKTKLLENLIPGTNSSWYVEGSVYKKRGSKRPTFIPNGFHSLSLKGKESLPEDTWPGFKLNCNDILKHRIPKTQMILARLDPTKDEVYATPIEKPSFISLNNIKAVIKAVIGLAQRNQLAIEIAQVIAKIKGLETSSAAEAAAVAEAAAAVVAAPAVAAPAAVAAVAEEKKEKQRQLVLNLSRKLSFIKKILKKYKQRVISCITTPTSGRNRNKHTPIECLLTGGLDGFWYVKGTINKGSKFKVKDTNVLLNMRRTSNQGSNFTCARVVCKGRRVMAYPMNPKKVITVEDVECLLDQINGLHEESRSQDELENELKRLNGIYENLLDNVRLLGYHAFEKTTSAAAEAAAVASSAAEAAEAAAAAVLSRQPQEDYYLPRDLLG